MHGLLFSSIIFCLVNCLISQLVVAGSFSHDPKLNARPQITIDYYLLFLYLVNRGLVGLFTVDDSIFNNYHFQRFERVWWYLHACVWQSDSSLLSSWKLKTHTHIAFIVECNSMWMSSIEMHTHDIEYIEYGIDWMI